MAYPAGSSTFVGLAPQARPWNAEEIEHPACADEAIASDVAPDEQAVRNEQKRQAWEAAGRILTDRQYTVFCLRMLTSLNDKQIGALLRLSKARINQLGNKAVDRLHDLFAETARG